MSQDDKIKAGLDLARAILDLHDRYERALKALRAIRDARPGPRNMAGEFEQLALIRRFIAEEALEELGDAKR